MSIFAGLKIKGEEQKNICFLIFNTLLLKKDSNFKQLHK